MLELSIGKNGNIFTLPRNGEAVCITTNGIVKANGHAVMGKGIALEADNLFHISKKLGCYLNKYGNRVFNMGKFSNGYQCLTVITFPTKYDWKDNSDINLICKSAKQLVELCNKFNITKCYLTPPGCGNGKLNWRIVKDYISPILDDRFIIVFRD